MNNILRKLSSEYLTGTLVTKITAFILVGFLLILGINFRPAQDYDYSAVGSLPENNGVTEVDFGFLGGYRYRNDDDIPEPVRNLDGKMVEVSGFMLPVDTSRGRVSSFLILRSRMACCFGVMPEENEFVFARMPEGDTVDYMNDTPVTVTGILNVGKRNIVSGIYTMEVSRFSLQN